MKQLHSIWVPMATFLLAMSFVSTLANDLKPISGKMGRFRFRDSLQVIDRRLDPEQYLVKNIVNEDGRSFVESKPLTTTVLVPCRVEPQQDKVKATQFTSKARKLIELRISGEKARHIFIAPGHHAH